MRPINVVIIVITVIESLRAFDIVYIINKGKNGLELLSILITNNSISEASLLGFGSAIAVVLLVISLVPIIIFLDRHDPGGRRHDRDRRARPRRPTAGRDAAAPGSAGSGSLLHVFLIVHVAALAVPDPVDRSTRRCGRIGDTIKDGYVSLADAPEPRQLRRRPGTQARPAAATSSTRSSSPSRP